MTFDLSSYFKEKKLTIENALKLYLPKQEVDPAPLHESMSYSVFAPGKRIRPILTLASASALGISESSVLPIACSLEMIHVFSLIHDDLPAMDDDDLRRGKPTNHKVYGEALAILAGDNLLAHAFVPLTMLDSTYFSSENIIKLIQKIALATGSEGMIAGQVIDILSEGKSISLERLKQLHRNKTGALIRIAVEAPAIVNGSSSEQRKALVKYGESIGLAFQIADDILDIEGGAEIGKDIGSDIANGKATYPALMGMEGAKKEAKRTLEEALTALDIFGNNAEPLREIAKFIVQRKT